MGTANEIWKRFKYAFLNPDQNFPVRLGLLFGKVGTIVVSILLAYSLFSEWGLMECSLCIYIVAPVYVFFEAAGIEGSVLSMTMYPLVAFIVYYFIGYILGMLSDVLKPNKIRESD